MNMSEKLARRLLEINAVALTDQNNLFTWVSGIKSPIYCDNRLTMSYPDVRDMIAEGLKDLVMTYYPEVEVLVGTATAGIPHAAWTAQKANLPMAYVRSSAKEHGKGNQIEGKIEKGQKVVVVEDLLSTGGSSIKVVQALKEAGAQVLGVVAIFSYGFEKVDRAFREEGVTYHTITNYTTLLSVAENLGEISLQDKHILAQWSKNPYIFTQQ